MVTITASVGKGGKNNQSDVDAVRGLLNRHSKWAGSVVTSGASDNTFIAAIQKFQKTAAALATQDGRVDPKGFTLTRLNLANIPGPQHRVFSPMCWNQELTISESAFTTAATSLGCEVAAIKAVAEVESRGGGYDDIGRPTILFERHKFKKFTSSKYDRTHPDISGAAGGYGPSSGQYPKLYRAAMLDEDAALKSASWGMFQIMGFNHLLVGYSSAALFVDAIHDSIDNHLSALRGLHQQQRDTQESDSRQKVGHVCQVLQRRRLRQEQIRHQDGGGLQQA